MFIDTKPCFAFGVLTVAQALSQLYPTNHLEHLRYNKWDRDWLETHYWSNIHSECVTDLDKLNLIKIRNGGLILGSMTHLLLLE